MLVKSCQVTCLFAFISLFSPLFLHPPIPKHDVYLLSFLFINEEWFDQNEPSNILQVSCLSIIVNLTKMNHLATY